MDPSEEITAFQEFFEKNLYDELLERVRTGKKFLIVEFPELAKFSPELADNLLETPEDTIKAAEVAVERFDIEGDVKNFKIRFTGLPDSQHIFMRNIRAKHINKLIRIEGIVRQKSDVRPQVTTAKFECPSCGNIINVVQTDSKFKSPSRCSCGRKGKFRLLTKELVDAQKIVLEEAPEDLEGGEQPKRLNIFLRNDLVSPMTEKRTNPGSRVKVVGTVKEIPITTSTGAQSTRFDLIMEGNYIEPVQEDYTEIELDPETVEELMEMSEDPKIFEKLVNSIAPQIYGHDKVKEALLLQMMGGVRKRRQKGGVTRGDIHVLLIGDPGAGKSALLKRVSSIAPKARYVSGASSTAAGLTATVVKDEFLRGYALEAGAMVLANKGICCTTADTEFVKENGEKMTFGELFENADSAVQTPEFKVMALEEETQKIKPMEIKRALMIKNDKKILEVVTKTGRNLKMTEDNEVLTCRNSRLEWEELKSLGKGDYLAVPKRLKMETEDPYSKDFAYLAGLVASDGSIQLKGKNARTTFYNTNKELVNLFQRLLEKEGYDYNTYKQDKGRKSVIRGEEVVSKKDSYAVYSSKKELAKKLVEFGVPAGNKSTENSLSRKIFRYSEDTVASFLKGVFDGDGSIRKSPIEVTFTTGLEDNARLFQELLTRLGVVSSVKKSTNSWHCSVRGGINASLFFAEVGTLHPAKYRRFQKMLGRKKESKDRIDVLPDHADFFHQIMKSKKGQLGASRYKYFWNYYRNNAAPSKHRLGRLNKGLNDKMLRQHVESDILWDQIEEVRELEADYVYDFTMKDTNNFVADNVIMHNCIDELDKMSEDDRGSMHEALEQQTVTVTKANIQATLRSETTLLAAANPKFGRFDPYEVLAKQIDLPSTLINRFDLIFPIRDLPDEAKDEKMASFILDLHKQRIEDGTDPTGEEIDPDIMRDYVAYARQRVDPILMESAMDEIKKYFVQMRSSATDEAEGIRAIPISARQLEALVRMAEASARTRLSDKVTKEDAQRAIDLLHHCLSQIGLDPDTGKIDIDRITTGVTASHRSNIHIIKDVIQDLEDAIGKTIPYEDIVKEAQERGVDETKVEEIIEGLKRSGDVFQPKPGTIQRI